MPFQSGFGTTQETIVLSKILNKSITLTTSKQTNIVMEAVGDAYRGKTMNIQQFVNSIVYTKHVS